MSEGHDDNLHEELAGFLLRRYDGAEASDEPEDQLADPNDVAAYAHGGLLPEQRARFGRQLLSDPLLRDQLAFEQGFLGREVASHRRIWIRRVIAAAGVTAAALVLGIVLPLALGEGDPPPQISFAERVRQGDAEGVIATLEARDDLDAGERRLLVLARFAAGRGDPLRGIDRASLPQGTEDLLPLSEDEITRLEEAASVVVRNGGARAAAREQVSRPRGLILAARPATTVIPGDQPLMLVVYRNHDQNTVFSRRIPRVTEEGQAVRLRYPDDAPELEPGVHYGVELRTLDDVLVAHASFLRADRDLAMDCRKQQRVVEATLPDRGMRRKAMARFYLRHDLHADAIEALRAVPAEGRDASWHRLRRLAHDLLGR